MVCSALEDTVAVVSNFLWGSDAMKKYFDTHNIALKTFLGDMSLIIQYVPSPSTLNSC